MSDFRFEPVRFTFSGNPEQFDPGDGTPKLIGDLRPEPGLAEATGDADRFFYVTEPGGRIANAFEDIYSSGLAGAATISGFERGSDTLSITSERYEQFISDYELVSTGHFESFDTNEDGLVDGRDAFASLAGGALVLDVEAALKKSPVPNDTSAAGNTGPHEIRIEGIDALAREDFAPTSFVEAGDEFYEPRGPWGEKVKGGKGDDRFVLGAGDDILRGRGGDDAMDGGAGIDLAIYKADRGDFAISRDGATVIVEDLRQGSPLGRDSLIDIEFIEFGSETFAVDDALVAPPPAAAPTEGNDTLVLSEARDEVRAGAGADVISDLRGGDRLFGEDGDDVFLVGAGRDRIDGGAGTDVAVFDGLSGGFRIKVKADGKVTVKDTDSADGDLGKNTLIDVEFLEFDDGLINVANNLGSKRPVLEQEALGPANSAPALDALVVTVDPTST